MAKEKKKEGIPVTMIFITVVIFLFGLGGMFLLISSGIQGRIVGGAIMTTVFVLLVSTIKRIPFPEVWVIDKLGVLIEKRSGYCIIVWFFGIEKKYLAVKAEIQYSISLFSDRKDIIIDLKKGGQIILKDPRIWILIRGPKKTAATALNFEEQIREISENRVAGILNNLTYDEVIAIRIPEAIRDEKVALKKKLDTLVMESEGLQKFLKECDIKYKGFTLDDFDFDEETTGKRRERITTEMGIEIARNTSEARKNEMLAIAGTVNDLQAAGFSSSSAQKTASERYQDHLAAKEGKLQKIIWTGGGGTIGQLASEWGLGKKLLAGEEIEKPESKQEPEPEPKKVEEVETKEEKKEEKKEEPTPTIEEIRQKMGDALMKRVAEKKVEKK